MRLRHPVMLVGTIALGLLSSFAWDEAFAEDPRAGGAAARGLASQVTAAVEQIYPQVEALYMDLHRNPELSGQERETAARFARELRSNGFQVTTGVGGVGVVALLRNGTGPTVMLRAELDGLPVEEKTGLPYASRAKARDHGELVPVMHACGHDVQMAGVVGAARILARMKDRWRGTLMGRVQLRWRRRPRFVLRRSCRL